MTTSIVWFRRDLRLSGNPAWADATANAEAVVPLFVVDPRLWDRASGPRRALLAGHLRALDRQLAERSGRLHVLGGDPAEIVPALAESTGADRVVVNGDVTPFARNRDREVAGGIDLTVHHGGLVHPPGSVRTADGDVYRVFTPFHRSWAATDPEPWPDGEGGASIHDDPGTGVPDEPEPPVVPGEEGAELRLGRFERHVDAYSEERDRPDLDVTSRLSIDLKWGTIGPRQVKERIGTATPGRAAFVRQLAWRDFYAHLMWDAPETIDRPLKPKYEAVRWVEDPDGLAAWREGATGYPLVDAGMRQLRREGWMHNRVRMVAASFLVKDLLVDWRHGERHFRHHLLDGDVASNVGNWQWVAGTGADAAPYFRVFNPVTQGRKFDPDGDYIRRWVPELADVRSPAIHAPWEAASEELRGVVLGEDYPAPIVDHAEARERALGAYRDALD